jgi:hypothetical protein
MSRPALAVTIMVALWAGIAALAAAGVVTLSKPPEGLEKWTELFVRVGVAAVGARVLWMAPQQLQAYLDIRKAGL